MNLHDVNNKWLEKLSRGDDDAFRMLFENYYPSLVIFAETYVKDEERARDIVQDVFLILSDRKEIFKSIDNLKSYLYTAVKNQSLKFLKHEKVKDKYQKHILYTSDSSDEGFLSKVLIEEAYRHLYLSIEKLPPQTQRVYKLALKGLKNQEIADELSISIETVKTHKQTGKKQLQKYMKDLMFIFLILNI